MSTTLKITYLKTLKHFGKQSLIATSVLGFPYRISLGDMFSENPFYNTSSNIGEVLATAAWVKEKTKPVIYDIGAHCGFISSQLAQLLKPNSPSIYSFEPVAPTFSDLVQTVIELKLEESVHPIAVALSKEPGVVKLNYSKLNSMLAQIVSEKTISNQRSGKEIYYAPASTLDLFCKSIQYPDVIKIDVEGWEVNVFQGGQTLLNYTDDVGICLEWNPDAINQAGNTMSQFADLLKSYRFFYINDYEGQKYPELQEVLDILDMTHVCNMFAIHAGSSKIENWKGNYRQLKSLYKIK